MQLFVYEQGCTFFWLNLSVAFIGQNFISGDNFSFFIFHFSLTPTPLELNKEFRDVLDEMEKTNNNLFITGRAGTGKSTLLGLFRSTTRKKCVVLAPTGVAALNVQGQTIHSFFGFPGKFFGPEEIYRRKDRRVYENLEVLIIDEISMVRADLFDNMDRFLRMNRANPQPFGGVQVFLFGDMFQLPPVVSSPEEQFHFQSYYDSPYFFSAKVFQDGFECQMIELNKVYRQEARHFIRLLDAVRKGEIDFDDFQELNERHIPNFKTHESYITLSSRNALVDALNEKELRHLVTPECLFVAETTGVFDPKQVQTDVNLRLKLGAQVMFIKNDPKREFVNGTIGKIIRLTYNNITVQINERGIEKEIEVEKQSWEMIRYKMADDNANNISTEIIGTFKQYPLRLAWAITIHKSQGKTFDKVIIDLGTGAFEVGQTYVALSRCRTLGGIVLKQPLRPNDIKVDERITDFYERNT